MAVTLNEALLMLTEPKWLLVDGVEWQQGTDRAEKAKANIVWKIKFRPRTVSAMPRGLIFRAETWVNKPSKAVFQLECDFPLIRKHITLYRLEMEPFGTHLNVGVGPPALCGLMFDEGVTHEHSFLHYKGMPDFNLAPDATPMAAITLNPPKDFDSAKAHVCGILNIQNGDDVPPLPQQNLLV